MNKFGLLVFSVSLILCTPVQAQKTGDKKPVVVDTPEQYELLKKQGQIPIMNPSTLSAKTINPIIYPGHKKTLQPAVCEGLQELDATL